MDTRGTYFNKSWLMFTGRTLEETLRTTWTKAVHPDDGQRRKDGQYCWVLHMGVPSRTEEGGPGGYLGSCVDVTDLRRCKGALQEQQDELIKVVQERTSSLLVTNACLQQEIAEHRQAEHKLREQHAQLRALASEVLEAEERERRYMPGGLAMQGLTLNTFL